MKICTLSKGLLSLLNFQGLSSTCDGAYPYLQALPSLIPVACSSAVSWASHCKCWKTVWGPCCKQHEVSWAGL